jgi:acyl dehydratase
MDVRFSSPVYPGETLRVDVWRIASEHAAFQVRTLERNVVVLDCGRFRFRAL